MPSTTRSVAVIGGGFVGMATAYALLNRGFSVTVFDRNRYAAMDTSFANGGQLSASNAETWNNIGTVMKGLQWMLRADAPLSLNLRPSFHKYSWMAEFLAAIPRYKANTTETARLAIAARGVLDAWAHEAGIDFDLERRGILHVYRTQDEFARAGRVSELLAKGGLHRDPVTPSEIAQIEPTLGGQWFGGYYTASDRSGDIHKFARGLSRASEERGADLCFGATVDRIKPRGEDGVDVTVTTPAGTKTRHFDHVVISAGVASRRFARQCGDRVNVYPVKGYSITVHMKDAEAQAAAPRVSLLDDGTKIVASRLGDDRFRVAGTAEINGFGRDIRADRVAPLVRWIEALFPGMPTDRVEPWAGLRPMMPDMMPRVGRGRAPCVWYNTGHGHLGWTLGAVTSEMLAAQLSGAGAARPMRRGILRPASA